MKKAIMSIAAIALLAVMATSCGSSEKCPAYSEAPTTAQSNA